MEEVVPDRGKIPSALYSREEGKREEREDKVSSKMKEKKKIAKH